MNTTVRRVNPAIASDADSRPARYRALHWAAVASLVFGGLSVVTLLGSWWWLLVPAVAVIFAWLALRQIAKTPEEYTGDKLAWIGVWLAAGFAMAGTVYLTLVKGGGVPHGYRRIDYAELEIDPREPTEIVPPRVKEELDGKKIFIEGYMVPGQQQMGLTRFILCRTSDQCRFIVPTPQRRELIRIQCAGDMAVDYTDRQVGIGGRLHADPNDPHGMPYLIEADYFR